MPMKNPLSDKDTFAADVAKSVAMAGKPGKYISMEKGLSAVRLPKIRIKEIYLDLVILMLVSIILKNGKIAFGLAKIGVEDE